MTDLPLYEKLGAFYLGRPVDPARGETSPEPLLYDSRDLLTHALIVGMTGSGKTGLGIALLEEAALDGIPSLVIDPKGDLGNLLLTFPDLAPADFAPWVEPEEAAREGISPAELAAGKAALWREGLARWDQGGERIARLRQAADFALYTPGSEAGRPVSILASLGAPPPEVLADGDLLRERVGTLAGSLLGLLGIEADPVRSREHILLSTLFDAAWRQGQGLDLATLIQRIQRPPVERIGVLDLESFFPAKERFGLAMALNNLLAAPGFSAWLAGEPLEVGRLLHDPAGRPRVSVFSIAHLSDRERMFFVTLLLSEVLSWMRTRPGTSSLRALLFMDEIFGFFPPVAEPPSKRPLLTLLKQARAFGLGVVLATQNPVDLDYKGLANIGTWFLGRLQTARDRERLLDGLAGAAGGLDRAAVEEVLAGLEKRQFLLHDVHEDEPVVFETRWVLSYLKGPLTRVEVQKLTAGAAPPGVSAAPAAPRPAVPAAAPEPADEPEPQGPVLPPGVPQAFLPLRGRPDGVVYRPWLLGAARLHYEDVKRGISQSEEAVLLAAFRESGPVDWYGAEAVDLALADLEAEPAPGAGFAPLPPEAAREKSYAAWSKGLADCLYRTRKLELWQSARFGETSRPGESEGDFRARLAERAREQRDAEVAGLREKYAVRVARLKERLRKAQQAHQREADQARDQKWQTGLSFGATVLGALFGRKALSGSTLSRATTAARGVGRTFREGQDVERAEENVEAVQKEIAALDAALAAEVAALEQRFDPAGEALETVAVKPRKADVLIQAVRLAWAPYRGGTPAW